MDDLLKKMHIASPCSADWNAMQGSEQMRHCTQCNRSVYNFSAMSEQEVQKLISGREGHICARLRRRQDGTVLTTKSPVGLKPVIQRVSRIAGITLSALMSAVTLGVSSCAPYTQVMNNDSGLSLTVMDDSGAVFHNAKIRLTGEKYQTDAITDGKGRWRLDHLPPGIYSLTVSHMGFEDYQKTISISPRNTYTLKATLHVQALIGDVVRVEQDSKTPLLTAPQPEISPIPVPSIKSPTPR